MNKEKREAVVRADVDDAINNALGSMDLRAGVSYATIELLGLAVVELARQNDLLASLYELGLQK